jgi:hypothetical protein
MSIRLPSDSSSERVKDKSGNLENSGFDDSAPLHCVFILSEKSSGSSYLHRAMNTCFANSTTPHTRHFENETLFWTKAASLLGLPQTKMLASEVPFTREQARVELEEFLSTNLNKDMSRYSDEALIFDGWYELIQCFGPVFIEKSPHHLLQRSVLSLMKEFQDRYKGKVNVSFVVLLRDPLAVIASHLRRWQVKPSQYQLQWRQAYDNIAFLDDMLTTKSVKLRFEDLIKKPLPTLHDAFTQLSLSSFLSESIEIEPIKKQTSANSAQKRLFSVAPETVALAKMYGYQYSLPQLKQDWYGFLWYLYYLYLRGSLSIIARKFGLRK